MSFSFIPEFYFESFDDVDIDFLNQNGFKAVLMDVDNTLEPYEHPLPGDRVMHWIDKLHKQGIKFAIISNNNADRIDLFNTKLKLPACSKARKPFKKSILKMLDIMDTVPSEAVFIGDQVFTDVWAAHNAGMRAILVPPIKDKKDIFTRLKRFLEKPIVRKFKKASYKKKQKNGEYS